MHKYSIREITEQIKVNQALLNDSNDKYYSWLRNIIAIAGGLVSILIALKSKSSDSCIEHLSFSLSIALISLGILSGSIVLYSEAYSAKKIQKLHKEEINKMISDKKMSTSVLLVKNLKVFQFLRWTCYLSFCLGLIALVCYSVISDA